MALYLRASKHNSKLSIPDADPLRCVRPLAAKALRKAPIQGAIDELPEVDLKIFRLFVGAEDANFIHGNLRRVDDRCVAEIEYFYVALRGFGLGTRLLKSFAAEAKARGAEWLASDQISNDALAVRCKIFGENALQFYHFEDDDEDTEASLLPMTAQQARLSNALIDAANSRAYATRTIKDPYVEVANMGVIVDLAQHDMRDWERCGELPSETLYTPPTSQAIA